MAAQCVSDFVFHLVFLGFNGAGGAWGSGGSGRLTEAELVLYPGVFGWRLA